MEKKEFERRRRRLMKEMGDNSIAILPTAPEQQRNRDVDYPYRPDSDFYYLTGFPEPEAVMVLVPGRRHGSYILFCRERDPRMETWNGRRAGLDGAVEAYGADDAFPISDIDDILPGLLENRDRVYYAMGCHAEFDAQVMEWVNRLRKKARAGVHTPGEFVDLDHLLHDMRLYKSAAEQRMMRQAARISSSAHCRAMAASRPGMWEYQIEAELLHEFMRHGARSPAYPSIVGGGENGCILHYTENDSRLNDGDLLLIDAGCEQECYASDITRTFPVNGRFSKEQRALYELVLEANRAAIAQVKPGNHWNRPHEAAVKVLTRGLVKLGLLKGEPATLIKKETYRRFFMHRTGHWLGMDVHDVGDYKIGDQWRVLEPGMTLTIEPGLYIPAGSKGVAKKWWNIGIRIEDDVLVTKAGCEVLTDGAPKDPDEIEALVGTG
ncbi:Xaa-Pro aminopeptidase [Thiohalomonas denitrificans]|uniref:Xaa-Pro aminopeptidase n=1 Tax=Thiohalomonas denitrificans TaxID=415747 RepID=A0A1G5R3D5_9GAMM|nr:Xaa-Pro aminopeptidase [Thiohalomonas denitrificans]SCZ68330.1 aminopeptidase P Metallo peptidase. MEROPS family M24B [Thiohalomonas denitrificans]